MAQLDDPARSDEGLLASINIVPFVDIVLVLLVVFMLTSAAIVKASLKVELPKAASKKWDVWDAVGIGLVHLRRAARGLM